ncbi:hypothetical protein [Cloacibacterium normanense]|uniref:hypothetical protein n=1 Tax=Cloacibacterium normanense TaxID=237258 RepID=UPI000853C013|nr:hypothetical protein [Cloacibacterium normanense]AZI69000.1 hypothetical protein EB819_03535 [Cloacibacterium normanense]SDO60054.1 hypothetical protein SAMN04489756_11140 [Cloacibacterium normanense]
MKNNWIILAMFAFLISCNKESSTTENSPVISDKNSKEVSLKQEAKTLTNDKGEKIVVTYFAEGIDLAMTLKKNDEEEHKLVAKGTNSKGEPIFTDGFYAWELSDDGNSGRLTDKQGNVSVFK